MLEWLSPHHNTYCFQLAMLQGSSPAVSDRTLWKPWTGTNYVLTALALTIIPRQSSFQTSSVQTSLRCQCQMLMNLIPNLNQIQTAWAQRMAGPGSEVTSIPSPFPCPRPCKYRSGSYQWICTTPISMFPWHQNTNAFQHLPSKGWHSPFYPSGSL